ncbi:MAG: YraN family protein [Ignavibacteria bacterium]|nr:YraN family protein [Ignavibacteria bacterium]
MDSSKKDMGKYGEELAATLLMDKGFEIIKKNYRYGKGEIDIVANDGDTLVFIEVKTRTNLNYGEPELAITKNKVNQLRKIGSMYCYENNIENKLIRFDVIAIMMDDITKPKINHIENAF